MDTASLPGYELLAKQTHGCRGTLGVLALMGAEAFMGIRAKNRSDRSGSLLEAAFWVTVVSVILIVFKTSNLFRRITWKQQQPPQ